MTSFEVEKLKYIIKKFKGELTSLFSDALEDEGYTNFTKYEIDELYENETFNKFICKIANVMYDAYEEDDELDDLSEDKDMGDWYRDFIPPNDVLNEISDICVHELGNTKLKDYLEGKIKEEKIYYIIEKFKDELTTQLTELFENEDDANFTQDELDNLYENEDFKKIILGIANDLYDSYEANNDLASLTKDKYERDFYRNIIISIDNLEKISWICINRLENIKLDKYLANILKDEKIEYIKKVFLKELTTQLTETIEDNGYIGFTPTELDDIFKDQDFEILIYQISENMYKLYVDQHETSELAEGRLKAHWYRIFILNNDVLNQISQICVDRLGNTKLKDYLLGNLKELKIEYIIEKMKDQLIQQLTDVIKDEGYTEFTRYEIDKLFRNKEFKSLIFRIANNMYDAYEEADELDDLSEDKDMGDWYRDFILPNEVLNEISDICVHELGNTKLKDYLDNI